MIFIVAFITNAIWENLHSTLYDSFMGAEITEFILLRAALADAFIIAIIALPFLFSPLYRARSWMIIPLGVVVAIGIEWYAFTMNMWVYNDYMPIVPLLSVGVTPMIQLGLLGYLSFKIQEKIHFYRFPPIR